MKPLLILLLTVALLVVPAGAITGGTDDTDGEHPETCLVGLRFLEPPSGVRCSGVLVHPRVVLTAGHCIVAMQEAIADGRASGIESVFVNFDPVIFLSLQTVEDSHRASELLLLPEYGDILNFGTPLLRDVGVIILEKPVKKITPAKLPTANLLDQLDLHGAQIRAVGYGGSLQFPPPEGAPLDRTRTRKFVDLDVISTSETYLLAQNRADAGTYFGDSGGPGYLTLDGERVLVSLVSALTEKGVGHAAFARVDLPEVLAFIENSVPRQGNR